MAYDNREELAGKIDWEGGLEDALDYGIKLDDLPEDDTELRTAWEPMQKAWEEFQRLADPVRELLPDTG